MNTEIPSVRLAVISASVRCKLDRYCGFRHVARNVHVTDFDPQQIKPLDVQLAVCCVRDYAKAGALVRLLVIALALIAIALFWGAQTESGRVKHGLIVWSGKRTVPACLLV